MRGLLLLSLTVLCGCATPYQAMGFSGGYRDTEVAPGEYEIAVSGNAFTNPKTLEGYFHRRAKEICDANGLPFYNFRLSSQLVRDPSTYEVRKTYGGNHEVVEQPGMAKGRVVGRVVCTREDPRAAQRVE